MGKMNQPLRVLIAGGFGYLGGRVAQYLVEQGHKVTLGSRKKRSIPKWLPQAEVVQLIWDDENLLTAACSNVNVIIHSAGMNAQDCVSDPVGALNFNGLATARLVQASKNAGVTGFIYLSTAHVYRSPLTGKIDETTCPRNLNPYATSHLAGENAVLYGTQAYSDFAGIVLRLSNVVGTPAYKNVDCWMLVVNDLCRQVVTNKRMEVMSSEHVQRDYIPILEVCSFFSDLVSNEDMRWKARGEIINVSNGVSMSLGELSRLIAQRACNIAGFTPDIEFTPSHRAEIGEPLLLSNRKATKISLRAEADLSGEIDGLLLNCDEWFGTKKGI